MKGLPEKNNLMSLILLRTILIMINLKNNK